MLRRTLLSLAGGAAAIALMGFGANAQGLPPLAEKPTYKVGFAQTESNNPWRLAQTASMKDEAAKRGWTLVYTDAAGSAAKQVSDVNSMIAQQVDVILLAPREEKPLIPAVMAAKKAGIPVFLIDRSVDAKLAGSYAFTTLLAVATSGWLMLKQLHAAQSEGGNSPFLKAKIAACRYYLDVMVPEAVSLKGSAMAGAELLYALDAEEMAI